MTLFLLLPVHVKRSSQLMYLWMEYGESNKHKIFLSFRRKFHRFSYVSLLFKATEECSKLHNTTSSSSSCCFACLVSHGCLKYHHISINNKNPMTAALLCLTFARRVNNEWNCLKNYSCCDCRILRVIKKLYIHIALLYSVQRFDSCSCR